MRTRLPVWSQGIVSRLTSFVLVGGGLALAAGCDRGPTTTARAGDGPVRLAFSTSVIAAPGAVVEAIVNYTSNGAATELSRDSVITDTDGADAALSLTADVSACVSSAPTGGACVIDLIVRLKRNGAILDEATQRMTVGPETEAITAAPVQLYEVASVRITGPAAALAAFELRDVIQLTATAIDRNGATVAGRAATWSVVSGVTIGATTGSMTAVSVGPAVVRAAMGGRTQDLSVTVKQTSVDTVRVAPADTSITVGNSFAYRVMLKSGYNDVLTGRPVTYTSSNAAIATVSSTGVATANSAGTATITVTSLEGRGGTTVTGTATLRVQARPPIVVNPATLTFQTALLSPLPAAQTVAVTNPGGGTVDPISIVPPTDTVVVASLDRTTVPATLTVRATTALVAGTAVQREVRVRSAQSGVADGVVTVTVQGLAVSQGMFTGLVTNASTGAPLAGASVAIRRTSDNVVVTTATTSTNGAWTSIALPAATYALAVSANGFTPVTVAQVTLTGGPNIPVTQVATVSLTLPGPGLTATVVVPDVVSTVGRSFAAVFPAGLRPVQGTGGAGTLTYEIATGLPSGLTFNANGTLTGTPSAVAGPTTYTVTVRDQGGTSRSGTFTLRINAAVAVSVAQSSVSCTQNAPCTASPLTVSGGTSPFTMGIAPALPEGLSLTSTGSLTGTPTGVQAATSHTATFTDAVGASATGTFALTVLTAPVTLLTTTLNIPSVIGCGESNGCTVPTPFTPVSASGGVAPYSYAITPTLPAGMSLNPTTGVISGAPTVGLSSTTFTVTVTSATGGQSSAKSFTFSSLRTTQNLTSKACTVKDGSIGALPYDATQCPHTPIQAIGGASTRTWSLSAASASVLSSIGMTIDPATGQITGSPGGTLSTTTITVRVTDQLSRFSENSYQLTVNTLMLLSGLPTIWECGDLNGCSPSLPLQVNVSRGTPPYTYHSEEIGSTGITGITMSSSGLISGQPDPFGVFGGGMVKFLYVRVTDAGGDNQWREIELYSLGSALQVSNQTCTVGSTCAFTPVRGYGGNTSPVNFMLYSVVGGTLPSSLTLDANTGQITGTPTVPLASTSITVRVSVGSRQSQKTFTLRVQ